MLRDIKAWVHSKAFQRASNGHGASLAFKGFYLVLNMVNEMASAAGGQITKARYTGNTKIFNFETYISLNKAQYQILHGLKYHGYQGMDEGTKIQHLTNDIKTDALNFIKAKIVASPLLKSDSDGFVMLFKVFISSIRTAKGAMNISHLNTDRDTDGSKGGGNRGGGGGGRNKGNRGGSQGNGGRGRGNDRSKRGVDSNKRRRNGNDSYSSNVSFR